MSLSDDNQNEHYIKHSQSALDISTQQVTAEPLSNLQMGDERG